MNGPAKLAAADNVTAWIGRKTRVPITVATEFAESLNPLTKSKISAIIMAAIAISNMVPPKYILELYPQQHQQHLHICLMHFPFFHRYLSA